MAALNCPVRKITTAHALAEWRRCQARHGGRSSSPGRLRRSMSSNVLPSVQPERERPRAERRHLGIRLDATARRTRRRDHRRSRRPRLDNPTQDVGRREDQEIHTYPAWPRHEVPLRQDHRPVLNPNARASLPTRRARVPSTKRATTPMRLHRDRWLVTATEPLPHKRCASGWRPTVRRGW